MDHLTPNLLAISAYTIASVYVFLCIKRYRALSQKNILIISSACLLMHLMGITQLMYAGGKVDLSIQNMVSMICWSINFVVLISVLRKPLHNLFIFLYPLSVFAIAVSLLLHEQKPQILQMSTGIIVHIILSVLAYSLIAVATLQALLCSWQNKQLRQHKLSGPARILPPLQTMEALIFDLLWVGQILLTLGIMVGFVTIDNIFAQQLLHKTVLSLFAWCIFAAMLWGRHKLGWRGDIAMKWVLSGFSMLMLGYFGSKVVIELLLA